MRAVLAVLALLLALNDAALAVQPDEMLADPALETRARTIGRELRCLVCQNQSIDDSDADLARDLRLLVRRRLLAGDSDRAVVRFIVERYGDYVLLSPPFKAGTALLWLGPPLLLGAAIGAAAAFYRRRRAATAAPLSAEERRRLGALLGEEGKNGGEGPA